MSLRSIVKQDQFSECFKVVFFQQYLIKGHGLLLVSSGKSWLPSLRSFYRYTNLFRTNALWVRMPQSCRISIILASQDKLSSSSLRSRPSADISTESQNKPEKTSPFTLVLQTNFYSKVTWYSYSMTRSVMPKIQVACATSDFWVKRILNVIFKKDCRLLSDIWTFPYTVSGFCNKNVWHYRPEMDFTVGGGGEGGTATNTFLKNNHTSLMLHATHAQKTKCRTVCTEMLHLQCTNLHLHGLYYLKYSDMQEIKLTKAEVGWDYRET